MELKAVPVSESSRTPGIGEVAVFSWAIEGVRHDDAWQLEITVEPHRLEPFEKIIAGRGPTQDLARFVAIEPGSALVSFVVNSGEQRAQWPITVGNEV
jgi:hypothetical protein